MESHFNECLEAWLASPSLYTTFDWHIVAGLQAAMQPITGSCHQGINNLVTYRIARVILPPKTIQKWQHC